MDNTNEWEFEGSMWSEAHNAEGVVTFGDEYVDLLAESMPNLIRMARDTITSRGFSLPINNELIELIEYDRDGCASVSFDSETFK